jgi:hypothetical protein
MHVVINDDVERALQELRDLVEQARTGARDSAS